MPQSHLPASFTRKKAAILSTIVTHASPSYTDKSPKGTIDAEIIDLIDEINAFEGYVTTSSCAGRVAVFVEGKKGEGDGGGDDETNGEVEARGKVKTVAAGPGGKGHGNRWLYVSHEPVAEVDTITGTLTSTSTSYHELFDLMPMTGPAGPTYPTTFDPRLIKLSFSPLILHILCSSLPTARPLLAAAINSGFRESGVQSLKALDDEEAGVMLAIRTAGCAFETIVGWVDESGEEEVYRSVVAEEWLAVLVGVASGRFGSNVERRERLREALRGISVRRTEDGEWEDKEERWRRKREEGLKVKEARGGRGEEENGHGSNDDDGGLGDGLFLGDT